MFINMSQGFCCADKEKAGGGRLSQGKEEGEETKEKGRAAAAEHTSRRIISWSEQEA